jgi:K+-transporting ATPase KdpF subunit
VGESRLPGVKTMSVIYVICGVIAVLLLVYLFVALLQPERF